MKRTLAYWILIYLIFSCGTKTDLKNLTTPTQRQSQEVCDSLLELSHSFYKSFPDSIIHFSQMAYDLAKSEDDTIRLITALRRLGVGYEKDAQLDKAYTLYYQKQYLISKVGLEEKLSPTYLNLGNIHLYQGDAYFESNDTQNANIKYSQAYNMYESGLEIAIQYHDSLGISKAHTNLGSALSRMEKYNDAIFHFEQSEHFWPANSQASEVTENQMNLFICKYELGKAQEAIDGFELLLTNDAIEKRTQILILLNMAGMLFDDNYIRSRNCYLKADILAVDYEDDASRLSILGNLSDLYYANGKPSEAYNCLKDFLEVKNQYTNSETEATIADLKERYQNAEILGTLASEKSSKIVLVTILTAIILFIALFTIVFFVRNRVLRLKNQRDQQVHLVHVSALIHDHEYEKLSVILKNIDAMREKLARELHDSLGATLSAVKMFIQSGTITGEGKIRQMSQILDDAINETRNFAHELGSASLNNFGLESSIKDLIDTTNSNTTLKCTYHIDEGAIKKLTYQEKFHFNRIIYECFTNTIKHAQAQNFEITINEMSDAIIQMTIVDDGVGFDTDSRSSGIGIKNMNVRCKDINAEMNLRSCSQGTQTTVILNTSQRNETYYSG